MCADRHCTRQLVRETRVDNTKRLGCRLRSFWFAYASLSARCGNSWEKEAPYACIIITVPTFPKPARRIHLITGLAGSAENEMQPMNVYLHDLLRHQQRSVSCLLAYTVSCRNPASWNGKDYGNELCESPLSPLFSPTNASCKPFDQNLAPPVE